MMTPPIDSPPPERSGDTDAERRRIQAGRNKVMALMLLAFVVLVYAIAIVKMTK